MTDKELQNGTDVWHKELQNGTDVWHTDVQQVTDVPTITYDVYGDEEAIEELRGPRSWVGPALASAIFCFLPTGLVAFYNARKAQKSFESGDLLSWSKYRGRARFLVFVTCFLGMLVYIAIVATIQGVKHTNNT